MRLKKLITRFFVVGIVVMVYILGVKFIFPNNSMLNFMSSILGLIVLSMDTYIEYLINKMGKKTELQHQKLACLGVTVVTWLIIIFA